MTIFQNIDNGEADSNEQQAKNLNEICALAEVTKAVFYRYLADEHIPYQRKKRIEKELLDPKYAFFAALAPKPFEVPKYSKMQRELAVKLSKLRNLNKKFDIHAATRGAAIGRAFKEVSSPPSYEDVEAAGKLIDTAAFAKVDLPTLFKFLDERNIMRVTKKRIEAAITYFDERVEMDRLKEMVDPDGRLQRWLEVDEQ